MTQDMILSGVAPQLHFTTFFEAIPGNCILLQNDAPRYTILAATPDYLKQVGVTKETIIGKGVFEAFPSNPADPADTGISDLKSSLEHVRLYKEPHQLPVQRYDVVGADGSFSERYWKAINKPVCAPDGEVVYIMHAADDITATVKLEKKEEVHHALQQAYKKIEESQAALKQFKFIADQARDPFILMREDGTFAYLNNKALEAWGYTAEEAKNIRVPDVDPIYNDAVFAAAFATAQQEELPTFETLHKRKDGHIYPVEVKMGGLTLQGQPHMFAVARDITGRKQAEEELRRSEDRFRTMVNAVPQSIWITDAEGNAEFLNQHWCDYCGVPFSKTTAAEISVNHLHPEDGPRVMQVFGEAMQTGTPFEVEQRNRSKEGEYRWFLNRAVPYKDPQTGKITKWFGISVDIHDRKLAEQAIRKSEEELERKIEERTTELAKANEELRRSNQNLEEFAYAASHDLKEPIRKIHFFSDRLKENLGSKLADEDRRYFERMQLGTRRMTSLIDDLLLYSHVSRGIRSAETMDLNQTLSLVLEDLELHLEEKAARIDIGTLPIIIGQQRQLQQLFENLIGNALKYSKPGVAPRITITSSQVRGKETALRLEGVEAEKQYHLIEVRDNGIGFHQEDAERIFNVFTRLHGNTEYKGTGVGLSIARKVVDNHGGYIWAEGFPGEGALFKVLLPVA